MRTTHRRDAYRATARLTLAVLLAGLPIVALPAAAADDLCGATIVADLKLHHDLTCVGAGLIAGENGIKIDLNGYTLSGAGGDVGIDVTGRSDVSIAGGTIRNFAVAVRVNSSTDVVIKQVEFVANPEGVDLQDGSVGNTIKNNAFRNSSTRAIMLRTNSSDNNIKNNIFTGNRVGILVFGGVDNTLTHNLIFGSSLVGIRLNVIATGNFIKNNSVVSNLAGIEFLMTPTGSATGNDFKGNTIATNDCGVKGPTADNLFRRNSFEENAADTCS